MIWLACWVAGSVPLSLAVGFKLARSDDTVSAAKEPKTAAIVDEDATERVHPPA